MANKQKSTQRYKLGTTGRRVAGICDMLADNQDYQPDPEIVHAHLLIAGCSAPLSSVKQGVLDWYNINRNLSD